MKNNPEETFFLFWGGGWVDMTSDWRFLMVIQLPRTRFLEPLLPQILAYMNGPSSEHSVATVAAGVGAQPLNGAVVLVRFQAPSWFIGDEPLKPLGRLKPKSKQSLHTGVLKLFPLGGP